MSGDPNVGMSATGIRAVRNSKVDCTHNKIRATVYSNSKATAKGISLDQSSVVTARNNDIAATVTRAELPNNFKSRVNTGQSNSATGILISGRSTVDLEENKIFVIVESNSPKATATGISADQSSTITAHKNEIMATVKSRGPQGNGNATTNIDSTNAARGMSSAGSIAGRAINLIASHPYISMGVLCGSIAITYVVYCHFSKPVASEEESSCEGGTKHSNLEQESRQVELEEFEGWAEPIGESVPSVPSIPIKRGPMTKHTATEEIRRSIQRANNEH